MLVGPPESLTKQVSDSIKGMPQYKYAKAYYGVNSLTDW
jgi:hypothetical protein